MGDLRGACLFAQSGGPTSVINASAAGVIMTAQQSGVITDVYGSANGIKGILNDVIYDMSHEDGRELELLLTTPSSALGSARYKLKHFDEDEQDYVKILDLFRKYDIRYFFFNGGNDSMDTCNKVGQYMKKVGYECRVMGVPKTIDNDLMGTDHCPGYGSAAKYISTAIMEVNLDAKVYDRGMVIVFEIMGRNAGWLTAAAALAGSKGYGADLVYLPEIPFSMERFLSDVGEVYNRTGACIVAASEGIRTAEGQYITEMGEHRSVDSFGHKQLGGIASILAGQARHHLSARVRPIELSLLQRCAAHCASRVDIEEAYMAGCRAVEYALEGKSGYMVGFERAPGPKYQCSTTLVDVSKAANAEKKIPREWINEAGNGLLEPFVEYALPLIQGNSRIDQEDGLPRFARLKKVRAAK
jgi:6-phosphofructokinase 1